MVSSSQESYDWMYDRYFSQSVWLKRTIVMSIILTILLIASLATNLMLFPLKEKVPYLYAFDHATGEVTQIGKLKPTDLSAKWEVTRYFLKRYVMNYESYDFDNIDVPYQQVWAQSGDHVRDQYVALVSSSNSLSPYKKYGKSKYITVHVTSVSRLNDNTVDIKFDKKLVDRSTNKTSIIQKEAIVRWRYDKAQTTQKMLDRDPLGFKVTYYQSTQVSNDKTTGV